MNPKALNVLMAVAFLVIVAFVILPFLPKEIRPSVAPDVEAVIDDGSGAV